jgi:hypothetical protein
MKRLIYITSTVFLLASCSKNITDKNIDPKNPSTVPSYTLYTQAQLNMSNTFSSSNVNLNIFRLMQQYWTETTYTDESNYDLGTRSIPDNWWNNWYRLVLNNFQQAKIFAATDVKDPDANVLKNDTTIIDIQQVYSFYVLVNTFGNVPYSQALNTNNPFPKYDDAKTLYYSLLDRLDKDIAALVPGSKSWGTADIIYGGNVGAWLKFANSLKLKMGILIADDDAAKAKSVVEAAAPNVFASNDDNALFAYQSSPPSTNPIWVDLVQSGRQDFVGATTVVNLALGLNDPRVPLYFTTDASNAYSGGVPGKGNTYSIFSKPGSQIVAPAFPGDILDYSEVNFLLAEAAARGFNVGGTAETFYDQGITASITFWGGTAANAAAYLAQPSIAYTTATGTWQQKIGTQAYLALYNRGFDSWTEYRRLMYPALAVPTNALSAFPLRFPYPAKEQNVNFPNYNTASTAIGGDLVTTKLWWDKN